jgi:hypothetical protein
MTRSINAATITALASDAFSVCHLIQLDFSTVIRITDWNRNVSALSNTFLTSAHLLEIGESAESTDPRINSLQLTMSGVEQSYVALFLGQSYIDVRGRIWKAVLGPDDAIVGAPFVVFDGRVASYSITDGDTDSTVAIELSSHWKDFELRKGRRTNRGSQQHYFPSDTGMDYSGVVVKDLKWGKK